MQVRRLGGEPDDVAIGTRLIDEYVRFTHAEAIDVGFEGLPTEIADFVALAPDLADFAAAYVTPGATYLTAFDRGEPLGGVGLRPHTLGIELKRLWVRPQDRGRGVAQRLCVDAIDWARDTGYAAIVLDVAAYRTGAIGLYERLGFTACPPINDYPFSLAAYRLEITDG